MVMNQVSVDEQYHHGDEQEINLAKENIFYSLIVVLMDAETIESGKGKCRQR